MSLRGRLEDLGVAEILHVVGAARRSGLLALDVPPERVEILFRDGTVVALRGAAMPRTLADLLSQAGALDADAREKAIALSQAQGVSIDEALIRLGVATSFRAQQAIEAEIERRLPGLVTLKAGAFEFSLRAATDPARLDFGALELKTGVPVWRLGASRSRVQIVPEGLGETTGARRARLLMDEERIALPGASPAPPAAVRGTAPSGSATAAPPPARASAPRAPARTVLHGLVSSPLRQRLHATLSDAGAGSLAVTSLPDVVAGVEAARARGEEIALACHAGHPDLPGLELLARLRSIDASAPAALLLSPGWPVARQAAAVERAGRLGIRLVAVIDERSEPDAADLASRLLRLLERDEAKAPIEAGTASESLDLAVDEPPAARLRQATPDLAALARSLAAAGESADIAREMLAVASEHHDCCYLLVTSGDSLELLGVALSRPSPPPEAVRALSGRGTDFLSEAIRTGVPIDGPRPNGPGDAVVLRLLEAGEAGRVTVMPLLAAGACFGALVATSEAAEGSGDLAQLSAFMMESSPALWEALSRERRRRDSRRSRA